MFLITRIIRMLFGDPKPVCPPWSGWTGGVSPQDLPAFRDALDRRNAAFDEYNEKSRQWKKRNPEKS